MSYGWLKLVNFLNCIFYKKFITNMEYSPRIFRDSKCHLRRVKLVLLHFSSKWKRTKSLCVHKVVGSQLCPFFALVLPKGGEGAWKLLGGTRYIQPIGLKLYQETPHAYPCTFHTPDHTCHVSIHPCHVGIQNSLDSLSGQLIPTWQATCWCGMDGVGPQPN